MDPARVLRLALPVGVIRQIDELVLSGTGGFASRSEFILDAVQERLVEFRSQGVDVGLRPSGSAVAEDAAGSVAPLTIGSTALQNVPRGAALPAPLAESILDEPLFGFHNRDYPSLWALGRIGALASDGPVLAEEAFASVVADAWRFGQLLSSLGAHSRGLATSLFPTNAEKSKAASSAFRSFALGEYRPSASTPTFELRGPLFSWRTLGIEESSAGPRIAPTDLGWSLLERLSGLTIEQPHPPESAKVFFDHLRAHAPADWASFDGLLSGVAAGYRSRPVLIEHMRAPWPSWTDNEASTNLAGYVARAREWGLLEAQLREGEYALTVLGVEYEHNGRNGL